MKRPSLEQGGSALKKVKSANESPAGSPARRALAQKTNLSAVKREADVAMDVDRNGWREGPYALPTAAVGSSPRAAAPFPGPKPEPVSANPNALFANNRAALDRLDKLRDDLDVYEIELAHLNQDMKRPGGKVTSTMRQNLARLEAQVRQKRKSVAEQERLVGAPTSIAMVKTEVKLEDAGGVPGPSRLQPGVPPIQYNAVAGPSRGAFKYEEPMYVGAASAKLDAKFEPKHELYPDHLFAEEIPLVMPPELLLPVARVSAPHVDEGPG